MTIEEVLARLEADRAAHTVAGPSDEEELRRLEQRLGRSLPPAFRAFVKRFGGGIFYQRHEIFGSRRTIIHDIELVPDLLSMRRRVQDQNPSALREGLLPVHRGEGVLHLMDLEEEEGPNYGRVVPLNGPGAYSDFASFLEKVVLPGAAAPDHP